jgi:hypothetical protein
MNEFSVEIERIKSLFNESRLYGNLVETCDSESEAITLLRSKDYEVVKPGNCTNPDTNLVCVKEILDDKGLNYKEFDNGGKCTIIVRGGHPNDNRKQIYMFVNDKNEFGWKVDYENPKDLKAAYGIDEKVKYVEYRGEFICNGGEIQMEIKVDRYKIDSSSSWVNGKKIYQKPTLDWDRWIKQ